MAFSFVEYVAGAAQDTFALTFEYLKLAHLHVYVDEVETTDFEVVGTDVVLDTPAVGGEVVRLQRLTPNTEAGFLVDFQDGQAPVAADFDTNRLQLLYIMQEALDGVTTLEAIFGTSEALPPAEGVSDFLISDAAGEDGWDVKTLAQAKAILGITGAEVLPPAEGVFDFLVSDAAGEDGWDVKSLAQTKTVLGLAALGEFLPAASGADEFLTSDGAGDDQWTPKTVSEVNAILNIPVVKLPPTVIVDLMPDGATPIAPLLDGTTDWYENDSGTGDCKVVPAAAVVTSVNDVNDDIDFSTFSSDGIFGFEPGTYLFRVALSVHHSVGSGVSRWRGALTSHEDSSLVTVYRILHGPNVVTDTQGVSVITGQTLYQEFVLAFENATTMELRMVTSGPNVGEHTMLRGSITVQKIG